MKRSNFNKGRWWHHQDGYIKANHDILPIHAKPAEKH